MSITIVKGGNLIEMLENDEIDILIHQCNCFQSLGEGISSGIARAIGDRYPETMEADLTYSKGDINQLGKYIIVPITTRSGLTKHIVNVYSQYDYGLKNGVPTHYEAMRIALEHLAFELESLHALSFRYGTYLLGTNRGGANKEKVANIMRETLKSLDNLTITV